MNKSNNAELGAFIKKMLAEKAFSCSICEKLLLAPVIIVDSIGNVCQPCYESADNSDWTSIPNTKLNVILKELTFPCKFQPEGCSTNVIYDELKNHEEECVYRSISCLLSEDDCEWTGRPIDLFQHFKDDHSRHVIISPFNEFSFELNVAQFSNVTKILNNKGRTCVLRIKTIENDGLIHSLQDIQPGSDVFLTLKYVGETSEHKLKMKCLPFSSSVDKRTSRKIRLSMLTELGGNTVKVVIQPDLPELKNLNAEVIRHLECFVCKDLMRPPIVQCPTGHSVCGSCKTKLTECPPCRVSYYGSNIRNFSLEGLTPSVQYPCVYSQYGCIATFLGTEIDKHEAICEFKMYDCPVTSCNFTGSYSACKNHFKANHSCSFIQGTFYESNFTLGSTTTETKYFFEHNNIYELTFSRSSRSCSWSVRILNHFDKDAKFFFMVAVNDRQVLQKKMTKATLCMDQGTTSTDENMVSFPSDVLKVYENVENSMIYYSCEIFEQAN